MDVESVYGQNYNASENVEIKRPVLQKLLVTLSPGLCQEIKHHVSSFKRSVEIMSHIKGSIKAVESGKLSREDYCTLSESRASSSLSMKTRELINDIFQNYEKMKMQKGEFDTACRYCN